MVNAQEWLDKEYPKEIRSKITELSINEKELKGNLDLKEFAKLTKLDLSNNYLTGISFPNNSNLTYLDITNNNFPPQDLSVFSKLTNLKQLFIRNEVKHWTSSSKETLITKYKFQNGIYNKFHGSLKPLKNLNKLELLNVSNTKIDSGLEYLPESLEGFYCQNIPCEKVKEWIKERVIEKERMLEEENERARNGLFSCLTDWISFDISECSCKLKKWKEDNLPLIREIRENDRLLNVCDIVARKSFTHEKHRKIFDILVFYLEEKLIEIRKKIYSNQEAQIEIPPK